MKYLLLLLSLVTSHYATAQTYDLVIAGGRVMDPETKYDSVANVGIKNGRIAIITKKNIKGKKNISAKGHVVAPGFIDTHFHWTRPIGYKLALRDGVTTAMDLEAGVYGPRVDQWYKMHEGKSQVNYGTSSGHEFARASVMDGYKDGFDAPGSIVKGRAGKGWSDGVPNLKQGNKMLGLIDEGLRQGALGIASTVGYFPGATARELYEVQKVAAAYGRPTSVHTRYTPGTVTTEVNGAQEILLNAIALNAPVVVNHYNNPGWELVQELLVTLRKRGFNVWGEYYPYAAGSTTLNAAFIRPENWVKKLGNKYEETLQDPVTGKFYTQDLYEKEVKENPTKQIVLYKMPPDAISKWVAMPGVVLASDAMPVPGDWDDISWDTPYAKLPNMHPRAAGSHGTALRLARENKIPLMQVLATFSYNPAKYLGDAGVDALNIRGRIQKGMVADITILNADSVKENSTYSQGALPTTGIPYVIVNGQVVVENSKVKKGVNPGQDIRYPVQKKGKFKPLSKEHWEKKFMVVPTGFYGLPEKKTASNGTKKSDKSDWFASYSYYAGTEYTAGLFCPIHLRTEFKPDTLDFTNGNSLNL